MIKDKHENVELEYIWFDTTDVIVTSTSEDEYEGENPV